MDSKSGWGGQSFTLSLAGVWERGIRKMCKELSPATGWRSLPSKNRIRPWDDANGQDDPDRLMISDILLQCGTERWVLDAKYKCGFGNESRNDRFQMCAYAMGFRASRATLVYPSQESSNFDQRELLSVDIGGTHVRIDSFALPMANGPNMCLKALRAKLQTV
jgi:5-methylcytosine-specific restriction endonuclease McrBC regulatory subunit McrC